MYTILEFFQKKHAYACALACFSFIAYINLHILGIQIYKLCNASALVMVHLS